MDKKYEKYGLNRTVQLNNSFKNKLKKIFFLKVGFSRDFWEKLAHTMGFCQKVETSENSKKKLELRLFLKKVEIPRKKLDLTIQPEGWSYSLFLVRV